METPKYRDITVPYCNGSGLDLGSGGEPVVPWAFQVDKWRHPGVHYVWDVTNLLFQPGTFDFVYASHVLEDFENWKDVFDYWVTLVKPGGHLIILVPDRERFRAAVEAGQPDNLDHRHEFELGELSAVASDNGLKVLQESHGQTSPNDYTIIFIAQKCT